MESLSLAPAAGKALAGTSSAPRAVCGAMCQCRDTELQFVSAERRGSAGHQGHWTPGDQLDTRGSLGTRGSAGHQALCARCLSMNFQGVGYSGDRSWEVLWW